MGMLVSSIPLATVSTKCYKQSWTLTDLDSYTADNYHVTAGKHQRSKCVQGNGE